MQCWRSDVSRAPDEIDLFVASQVAIYHTASGREPELTNQTVALSSHRIVKDDLSIPLQDVLGWECKSGFLASSPKIILNIALKEANPSSRWKCPACEEENEGGLAKCEVCGTWNPSRQDQQQQIATTQHIIRLSFRGSGFKQFSEQLGQALQKKAWLIVPAARNTQATPSGVSGLLRQAAQEQARSSAQQSAAFGDLDALLGQAGEMAKLAESISSKLASRGAGDALGAGEDQEFRALLADIGLSSSAAMAADRSTWLVELAKQLANLFGKLCALRNIQAITLADAYCYFNRARGTDLVAPSDLAKAASLMGDLGLPVRLRKLKSGLLVLQSTTFSEEQLLQRIKPTTPQDYITPVSLAKQETISSQLATELLDSLSASGKLCLDWTPSGPRYYQNLILFH